MTITKLKSQYRVLDNVNVQEMTKVQLTVGKYAGMTYCYGDLKFSKEGEEPVVRYVYEVFDNPNNLDFEHDPEFKSLISSILDDILVDEFGNRS